MSYTDDIAKLTVMRDDLVGKDAATARLLQIIVSYGGDDSLAQTIIDADVAIQSLVLAQIAATAAGMTTAAAAVPDVAVKMVQTQQAQLAQPEQTEQPQQLK